MRLNQICSRALRLGVIALCLAITGCATCPIPTPPHAPLLQSQPESNLDDVHVIFVESPADLGHWGRLKEVCCSLRQLGLNNAIYFEPIVDGNSCDLVECIRDIRAENPNSRIMLVGWSMGSLYVKDALIALDRRCEGVETVVYIDSGFLTFSEFVGQPHPDNADRILLIYRSHQSPPCCIPNSEVQCIDSIFHLPVAHHCDTVDSLVQEAFTLSTIDRPTTPFLGMTNRTY